MSCFFSLTPFVVPAQELGEMTLLFPLVAELSQQSRRSHFQGLRSPFLSPPSRLGNLMISFPGDEIWEEFLLREDGYFFLGDARVV